jgi:hypothetical protein
MLQEGREMSEVPAPSRVRDTRVLWAGLGVAVAWWVLEAGIDSRFFGGGSLVQHLVPRDTHELWMRSLVLVLFIGFGIYAQLVVRRAHRARVEAERLRQALEDALTHALSGFLPICASCKCIRLEGADASRQDSWQRIESYIAARTEAQFSHSVCPACEQALYGDLGLPESRDYEI